MIKEWGRKAHGLCEGNTWIGGGLLQSSGGIVTRKSDSKSWDVEF